MRRCHLSVGLERGGLAVWLSTTPTTTPLLRTMLCQNNTNPYLTPFPWSAQPLCPNNTLCALSGRFGGLAF